MKKSGLKLCVFLFISLLLASICYSDNADQTAGIVAWWSGDGSAEDSAGNNDGILKNGTTYTPGIIGEAFSFDGIDDYISVPDHLSLRAENGISIVFWGYFNSLPSGPYSKGMTIIEKKGDYILYWRADTQKLEIAFTTGCTVKTYFVSANTSFPSSPVNEWHHFAVTAEAGNPMQVHFYYDGEALPTVKTTNPDRPWCTSATGELRIGARHDLTLPFNGMIDELMIYNRALSENEL